MQARPTASSIRIACQPPFKTNTYKLLQGRPLHRSCPKRDGDFSLGRPGQARRTNRQASKDIINIGARAPSNPKNANGPLKAEDLPPIRGAFEIKGESTSPNLEPIRSDKASLDSPTPARSDKTKDEDEVDGQEFESYCEELAERSYKRIEKRLGYDVPAITHETLLADAPALLGSEYGIKATLGEEIRRITGRQAGEFIGKDFMSRRVTSGKWVNFETDEEREETMEWTTKDRERTWGRITSRRTRKGKTPIKKEFAIELEGIEKSDRKAVVAKLVAGQYNELSGSGLFRDIQLKLRANSSYTGADTRQIMDKIGELLPKESNRKQLAPNKAK
ncbi:MAG: hypothetical protein M1814_002026 [Vezdaea aestivalis]|nr:MAG: hypothetical protein M1814_002026 [Vezdaea aestivalis]